MPSPGWIRITIGLLAAAMVALSALTGESIDEQGLRWIGGAAGGITLLLLAFDRWIWRWPGVRWLSEVTGTPVLHGTWSGLLDYTRDGEGNPGQTPIYMAICQTYSAISVRCYFPQTNAQSWSLAAALISNEHRHDLRYVYQQMAPVPDRDANRPTEGACELAVAGRPVATLSGSYYSERGGSGRINLPSYSPKLAGSLEQSRQLDFSERAP